MESFYNLYARLFARRRFFRFNNFLFELGLRGLGVLNYQNLFLSGEKHFIKKVFPDICKTDTPVIFDVGANVGDYTSLVLDEISNAVVFAFEPHPITYKKMISRLKKHKVRCFNIALSNEIGNDTLYDKADTQGSTHATMYKDVISEIHYQKIVEVPIVKKTLDSIIEEESVSHIDLLKIDTEGNELFVLEGAVKSLESGIIKLVHFEFNEMNVISRTYMRDFRKILTGYKLFRLLPNGMIPISFKPLKSEIFAFQNIVAIREQ